MTNQDDVVTAALHLSRAIMRENGKILRPTCSLKRFRQALVHFCTVEPTVVEGAKHMCYQVINHR